MCTIYGKTLIHLINGIVVRICWTSDACDDPRQGDGAELRLQVRAPYSAQCRYQPAAPSGITTPSPTHNSQNEGHNAHGLYRRLGGKNQSKDAPSVYSVPSRDKYVQERDVCPDPAALRGAGPEQDHVLPQ